MNIELGKKYVTRSGGVVRIIAVDRKHPTYPVVALKIRGDHENEFMVSLTARGESVGPDTLGGGDIVEEYVPKPDVNWAWYPVWMRFIAQDKDGFWYLYSRRPERSATKWVLDNSDNEMCLRIPPAFNPEFAGDWTTSLAQRP